MRVLVTGAFGVLGRAVVLRLNEAGHDVTCFDIRTGKNRRARRHLQSKAQVGDRVIWGDISDKELVKDAVAGKQAVIHLAAILPLLRWYLLRHSAAWSEFKKSKRR